MNKNANNSKVVAALTVKSGVQAGGRFSFLRKAKPAWKVIDKALDAGSIASTIYDAMK